MFILIKEKCMVLVTVLSLLYWLKYQKFERYVALFNTIL